MIDYGAKLNFMIRTNENDKVLGRRIAKNIASRRKQLGLTQKQLAEITGKKQPHIARLERSNYGRHTIHSLNQLATALDTTVSELTKEQS